jgi:CHASE domain
MWRQALIAWRCCSARDRGRPAATGRLTLVQEPTSYFVLLVFLPIYAHGLPHVTVEERRQNLHGYATGVFQIGDMVEASLPYLAREGLELRIEDKAAPPGQQVLYDSRGQASEGLSPAGHGALGENPTGVHWQTIVDLAGRSWQLRFAPTLAFLADRQSLQPWTVLGGGLVFTGALGAFLLIVTGRAAVIEQLMAERTAQLEASQRTEVEAEQRRREADVLAELARTINATLDVEANLQRVADGAKELCNSDGAAIALCEPGAEAAAIRYWAGTRSPGVPWHTDRTGPRDRGHRAGDRPPLPHRPLCARSPVEPRVPPPHSDGVHGQRAGGADPQGGACGGLIVRGQRAALHVYRPS